jgi:L-fuculose-phosphate aldolase
MDVSELRREVMRYGQLLVEHRLIQATWGNVSVRVDDDHFLISPSGVDYNAVTPGEVALVSIADGSYDKGLHPSSERRMHQLIYQERPDIRAIVHTHSANCAVFAACHADLLTEVLDYPCAPYAVSGSKRLATNVSRVMIGHDGCILANHGFVTGADTLGRAFARAQEAEAAAGRRFEA